MRKRHTTQHRGIRYRLDSKAERRYLVYYSDSRGGEHTLTLPPGSTLEDARLKRGELMSRKSQGENLIPSKKLVFDLLNEWLEHRKGLVASKTIEDYTWAIEFYLKPHLGHLRVRDLTVSDIVRLRTFLVRKGLKKWSIAKIETPLKNALTVAARDGLIPANPFGKLLTHERVTQDAKKPRAMAKDEIGKVLSVSTDRWRPLFSTLLFTGLRIGEALALTWDDVEDGQLGIPACPECFDYMHQPGMIEAAASAGIEHGKSTGLMLREVVDHFHAQGHRGSEAA